jgi:hypothetical protein
MRLNGVGQSGNYYELGDDDKELLVQRGCDAYRIEVWLVGWCVVWQVVCAWLKWCGVCGDVLLVYTEVGLGCAWWCLCLWWCGSEGSAAPPPPPPPG